MLRLIRNKILNYFFIRFEIYNKDKSYKEKQSLFSDFKIVGRNISIGKDHRVINPKYIEIGDNFLALDRFRIETFDNYNGKSFTPKIKIGNNVVFNTDVHIGCINSIEIGDNCLFASRIYITDHNHGETSLEMLKIKPSDRPLVSKGPVVIKNNVFIGTGVAIMPNVTIGENSIVVTNAVVTKDVPPNAIVAGIPAVIIKQF